MRINFNSRKWHWAWLTFSIIGLTTSIIRLVHAFQNDERFQTFYRSVWIVIFLGFLVRSIIKLRNRDVANNANEVHKDG